MTCPLCGGPLHVDDVGRFACERQHAMDPDQMRVAASARVSSALWLSIEALQSEAEALRILASRGASADGLTEQAEQAEKDALLLRGLAAAHVPPGHTVGALDGT